MKNALLLLCATIIFTACNNEFTVRKNKNIQELEKYLQNTQTDSITDTLEAMYALKTIKQFPESVLKTKLPLGICAIVTQDQYRTNYSYCLTLLWIDSNPNPLYFSILYKTNTVLYKQDFRDNELRLFKKYKTNSIYYKAMRKLPEDVGKCVFESSDLLVEMACDGRRTFYCDVVRVVSIAEKEPGGNRVVLDNGF